MLGTTKILSAEQIRLADKHTIENEPITSLLLMERASKAFVAWFTKSFNLTRPVKIFCGTGNNGGDGMAIGRLLSDYGYKVQAFYIGDDKKGTPDFVTNLEKLKRLLDVVQITDPKQFPDISGKDIVVDGIFGSGLSRKVQRIHAELINYLNGSKAHKKIAIDIASGLFSDTHSDKRAVMKVDHTISFQVPKLAFVLPQSAPHTGDLEIVDIGLNAEFIAGQETNYALLNLEAIRGILKQRPKFAHKGMMGKCLLMAGSYGKMGAALLAAKACLRAGSGLLTVAIPKCGYDIMQSGVPEAMVEVCGIEHLSECPATNQYNAVGVGPGLSTHPDAQEVLESLIKQLKVPVVLDADALNILSENQSLLSNLPSGSILTPHPGEFERLVGTWKNDFDRLEIQRNFSLQHQVIVLLKGAHSSISTPDGQVYFNTSGNPGMATAGSGDVLTGMITSFMGQGYNSVESTLLGGYLHGLSGDLYIEEHSEEGLIAGDLVDFLPKTFKKVNEKATK